MHLVDYIENQKYKNMILEERITHYNNKDLIRKNKEENIMRFGYHADDPIPYSAVLFINTDTISIFEIRTDDAIISFGFTGCSLVKFSIDDQKYAAHIPPKMEECWKCFEIKNKVKKIISFTPNYMKDGKNVRANYPAYRCWGIIENDDNCFDLIVYEDITYIDGIYSMVEKKCSCCTIM